MPLFEHIFIARQDLSDAQAERLIEHFGSVLGEQGGKIVDHEYWGVKTMAYKINKNCKGRYAFLRSDAPAPAVQEMERLMRLHDDVMRVLTIKVSDTEEGPSVQMVKADPNRSRGRREMGSSLPGVKYGSPHSPESEKAEISAEAIPTLSAKNMSVKWIVEDLADAGDEVKEMVAQIEAEAKNLRRDLDASNSRVSKIISEIEGRH